MFYNQKFIVNDIFELLFNVDSNKSVDDKFMIMKDNNKIKLIKVKNKIPDGYHDFYHIREGITIEPFNFKCKLNIELFKRFKYVQIVKNSYIRCECCHEQITLFKKHKYCFTDTEDVDQRKIGDYICLPCHDIYPVFIFELLKEKIIMLNRIINNDDIFKYILSYLKYINLDTY